jgi:tetratricopeptide (TPR) repeat protein
MLAKALYMNGNLSDARSRIQAHLTRRPDDAAGHLLAGRIYIASSTSADSGGTALLETAEKHLEKAVALDPGSPEAYMILGDCRVQMGDAPAGLAAYMKGIEQNPEFTALHERLVSIFTGSEFLSSEDALSFYKDLLGRGEATPAGKGNLWWFLGAWNEAIARAAYAEERFTEAAAAYAESASCYEKCGFVHEPFAEQAQAQQAQAWANTGWSHFYGKEYELAEARFSKALTVQPDLQNAILGIDYVGTAVVNEMGMEEGRDFFRRQAQANPWNSRWWNNYALLCRETGRYEESYTAYVKAMNLSPDDTRYINDAGMMLLYYLKRQPEKAEEYFKRAWKAGDEKLDNPFLSEEDRAYHFEACCDAMLNLARLYLTQNRADEAEPIARAVAEKAPERPDVQRLLISVRETKEGKPYVLPE